MPDDQELRTTVRRTYNAVFGDPDNPNDTPGLIADHRSMRDEQARTNGILTELRGDVKKVQFAILLAVLTAVLNLVLKKDPAPAPNVITSAVQR